MFSKILALSMVASAIVIAILPLSAQSIVKNNGAKLIEIGPADWEPMDKPLKWSPTGAMLSYFNDDFLMISDTLGNNHRVDSIDLKPYRYEWLSDDQIIVNLRALRGNIDTMKIVIIDANSGDESILAGDADDIYDVGTAEDSNFLGPFLTVQGNAYYLSEMGDFNEVVMPPSEFKTGSKATTPADNQILRHGEGGLYLVKADGSDSTRIDIAGSRNASNFLLSSDRAYLFIDGIIIRLADSTRILLDTIVRDAPPQSEGCGIIYPTFSPASSEILFQIGCDNDHSWLDNSIAIFNYASGKLTMLDSLTGINNCTAPSISPDGRKIVFLADGNAYILYRDIK